MFVLKIKSEESYKAGEILQNNSLFASSIHAYYYSCLQLMLYILMKIFGKTQEDIDEESKNKSFHNWIINIFHSEFLKNDGLRATRFYTKIQKLKKYRIDADYKNVEISESKSITACNITNEILKLLQEDYLI